MKGSLRYPEYQSTDIDWLSEIPSHWDVKRLKFACTYNDEALPETTDADYEFDYVDISSVSLVDGITHRERLKFEKAPSRARRVVRCGDSIVSTVRTYLKAIATIDFEVEDLIVSTGFAVLRPEQDMAPRYLGYYVQANGFVDSVVARSTGVSYPAINASELVRIPMTVPPLEEQRTIAAFLDRETARIDALIEKKRRLLELLEEKRLAIITQAMTKGLDPDAPMKDSGIEWLGEVPAHWEVIKVSRGFDTIGSGTTPRSGAPEYYDEGIINWLTTSELRETEIFETTQKVTNEAVREYSALKIYPSDSVVIAMYGATIGRLGILRSPSTVNQACCVFDRPTRLYPRFFFYWLWGYRRILISMSVGGGQPNLSQEILRSLQICAPPLDEQRAIAAYIDSQLDTLGIVEDRLDGAKSLLQEYRSTLITNAVTGKIDVRNLVEDEAAA